MEIRRKISAARNYLALALALSLAMAAHGQQSKSAPADTLYKMVLATGKSLCQDVESLSQCKVRAERQAIVTAVNKAGIPYNFSQVTQALNNQEIFQHTLVKAQAQVLIDNRAFRPVAESGQSGWEVEIQARVRRTTTDRMEPCIISGLKDAYRIGEGIDFIIKSTSRQYHFVFVREEVSDSLELLFPVRPDDAARYQREVPFKASELELRNTLKASLHNPHAEIETTTLYVLSSKINLSEKWLLPNREHSLGHYMDIDSNPGKIRISDLNTMLSGLPGDEWSTSEYTVTVKRAQ